MPFRWSCGGLLVAGVLLWRFVAGAALPQPAFARGADRLPAQDPAAHRHRGGRSARRIRRGAARRGGDPRSPGRHEKRDSGRRRRAFLPARRRRLHRACCAPRCSNLVSGGTQQGAGTITMQVARNFFLTREKTVTRKLARSLLAWKIEANLSKDEILELYVNQIFLGQRAYGFARGVADLLRQAARRADTWPRRRCSPGLPKAPSAYNPVTNPQRAKSASSTCCGGCTSCGYITDDAVTRKHKARHSRSDRECARHSDARRVRGRDGAAGRSFEPTATRPTPRHHASRRPSARPTRKPRTPRCARACSTTTGAHGYRGPEGYVEPAGECRPSDDGARRGVPASIRTATTCSPAVVAAKPTPSRSRPCSPTARRSTSRATALKFAARALDATRRRAAEAHPPRRRSSGVRARRQRTLGDRPDAAGRSRRSSRSTRSDGAILSLVGGFDFDRNKFNHVTQALAPAGIVVQAVHLLGRAREGLHAGDRRQRRAVLRPGGRPAARTGSRRTTTASSKARCALRTALAKSKNLVTVRVLQAIGPQYAQDYIDPLRLRPEAASALPDDGARRRLGHAAADGDARTRSSPTAATASRPTSSRKIVDDRGNVLSEAEPDGRRRGRRARDRSAQRLHHDHAAAGRRRVRHGDARAVARPQRPRGQDRHDERERRRVVLRLQRRRWSASPGSASTSRRRSARNETGGGGGAADLDLLHGEGAEGCPGGAAHRPGRASSACR